MRRPDRSLLRPHQALRTEPRDVVPVPTRRLPPPRRSGFTLLHFVQLVITGAVLAVVVDVARVLL